LQISAGPYAFDWIDNWAQVPPSEMARIGWSHPGMAVTVSGEVVTCHPGVPELLVYDQSGVLLRMLRPGLTEGHGITAVNDGDVDSLWVADSGSKRAPDLHYEAPTPRQNGQVIKMTLGGEIVARIEAPDLPVYRQGATFSPTSVAVNEERHGGNGDVWVADGYGQSLVHRYSRFDKHGEYVGTLHGGDEPGGPFSTPHGLWFDTRRDEPELYVADRSNRRIQVFDPLGHFKRSFGADYLTSPSAFALLDGETLVVAELRARLALVDRDDRLIDYLGANDVVGERPGWPNAKDEQGESIRPPELVPGKFNSPHGLAADRQGNLYVAEWLIGGRYSKLRNASAANSSG
jgi:hypothetical protein